MELGDDVLKMYLDAGSVAKETIEYSKKIVKPGKKILDVVETLEKFILSKGMELAFPVNLSINEIAAHDTADLEDERIIPEESVVKIDVGVLNHGYIADTATTIDLSGQWNEIKKACSEALNNALKMMTPGTKIYEVSEIIEETINSYGFKPVSNLTGHKMERYLLHGKIMVPNVKCTINYELKEGDVFAIEPFATNGFGKIEESGKAKIYSICKTIHVRDRFSKKIIEFGLRRKGLPFSLRWIFTKKSLALERNIRDLILKGALYDYRLLKEVGNGIVAQEEHSVIVSEKPLVYTK